MIKTIRLFLLNLAVIAVLIELFSLLYFTIKKPIIPGWDLYPTYINVKWDDSVINRVRASNKIPHFIDTTYPWSTWHPRNAVFINGNKDFCYLKYMHFNAIGSRGPLPDSTDSRNILFVGDSYTEGYALEEDSTISARVSRLTGRPTLNLGTSGHIGTTQMGLIYDHFGARFRHRQVYVLLYLYNDFTDNDINQHDQLYPDRYRPYRVPSGDLSVLHYRGSLDSSRATWRYIKDTTSKQYTVLGLKSIFTKEPESLLLNTVMLTYTARLIVVLNTMWLRHERHSRLRKMKPFELLAGVADWQILEYDLEYIMDSANKYGAKVTFLNLPSRILLEKCNESPDLDREYLYLENRVRSITESQGHRYLSFYEYLREERVVPKTIFYTCDPHYNNTGERLLQDFILASGVK